MIGQPATVGNYVLTDEVEAALVEAGYSRNEFLLATDTAVVVPVNKTVVMTVTAADVIHSWTIPAFGVKQDGVPGRLAQLWFKAEKEGVYFGQCSELCGKDHAYMPITVKVVSEEAYENWLKGAKEEYASAPAHTQWHQVRSIPQAPVGGWGSVYVTDKATEMSDASLHNVTHENEAQFGDYFALLKPRVMTLVVFTPLLGCWQPPFRSIRLSDLPRFCSSHWAVVPRVH